MARFFQISGIVFGALGALLTLIGAVLAIYHFAKKNPAKGGEMVIIAIAGAFTIFVGFYIHTNIAPIFL